MQYNRSEEIKFTDDAIDDNYNDHDEVMGVGVDDDGYVLFTQHSTPNDGTIDVNSYVRKIFTLEKYFQSRMFW